MILRFWAGFSGVFVSSQLFFRDYAGNMWYNEGTKGADSNPLQKPVKL